MLIRLVTSVSNTKSSSIPSSAKKTINPDESFFNDILNFDKDDNDELDGGSTSPLIEVKHPDEFSSLPSIQESKCSPNKVSRASSSDIRSPIGRTKSRTTKPLRKPLSSKSKSVIGGTYDQMESVKLSLYEFGHIRVQETRGELETRESQDQSDLMLGRLCFCCKTVRFRMLNWAYNCHFCKKNVRTILFKKSFLNRKTYLKLGNLICAFI